MHLFIIIPSIRFAKRNVFHFTQPKPSINNGNNNANWWYAYSEFWRKKNYEYVFVPFHLPRSHDVFAHVSVWCVSSALKTKFRSEIGIGRGGWEESADTEPSSMHFGSCANKWHIWNNRTENMVSFRRLPFDFFDMPSTTRCGKTKTKNTHKRDTFTSVSYSICASPLFSVL